jgi:hypothetical protein
LPAPAPLFPWRLAENQANHKRLNLHWHIEPFMVKMRWFVDCYFAVLLIQPMGTNND